MTLGKWLASNRVRQDDFARRIGVTQGWVSRLVKGSLPDLPLAFRIERETAGAVPAASWARSAGVAPKNKGSGLGTRRVRPPPQVSDHS